MRLLSYIPQAGIPESLGNLVRLMAVEATDEELPYGYHEALFIFDLHLNDVTVINHEGNKYVAIKSFANVGAALNSSVWTSDEYRAWFGDLAPAPGADSIIAAHIIKGKLPNLHRDFDAFCQWFKEQLAAVPRLSNVTFSFEADSLIDSTTKQKYDLWAMYRYYLMIEGKMTIGCSPEGQVTLNDLHISEKGISWWLEEHNRQMMCLAAEQNLLAVYLTFGMNRNERDFYYTFVSKLGDSVKRPVDDHEYVHLAMHGQFPTVSVTDEGKSMQITVDCRRYFPDAYHTFMDNAWYGSSYARRLLRFI